MGLEPRPVCTCCCGGQSGITASGNRILRASRSTGLAFCARARGGGARFPALDGVALSVLDMGWCAGIWRAIGMRHSSGVLIATIALLLVPGDNLKGGWIHFLHTVFSAQGASTARSEINAQMRSFAARHSMRAIDPSTKQVYYTVAAAAQSGGFRKDPANQTATICPISAGAATARNAASACRYRRACVSNAGEQRPSRRNRAKGVTIYLEIKISCAACARTDTEFLKPIRCICLRATVSITAFGRKRDSQQVPIAHGRFSHNDRIDSESGHTAPRVGKPKRVV